MAIAIVRLGTRRARAEGVRIGTVRRPPRGVPKRDFAKRDFYDAWLPELAPSDQLVKLAQKAATDKQWQAFVRGYRREMRTPEASRLLQLLAVLSHTAALSVGCYCENEARCHRSILRELLREHGAALR
jgi:uncharacterized protein YeaO (DUF488 family)